MQEVSKTNEILTFIPYCTNLIGLAYHSVFIPYKKLLLAALNVSISVPREEANVRNLSP